MLWTYRKERGDAANRKRSSMWWRQFTSWRSMLWQCTSWRRYYNGLRLNAVIDPPLTPSSVGHISCRAVGIDPIEFVWYGPNGSDVQTDLSGANAFGVVAGHYRVVATDAEGSRAELSLDIEPTFPGAVLIREYRTTPASTSHARDGAVEAIGHGLEGWHFLWTNGIETEGTVLRDVPCGTYAAIAISPSATENVKPPVVVHQSVPARVLVK
jgi:hypothetical protein